VRVNCGGSVIDPGLVDELVTKRQCDDPLGDISPRERRSWR